MPLTPSPHLELHPHEPEFGVWCPSCGLPSAVRVRFAAAERDTLRVVMHGAHVQCLDCGRWWSEDD